MESLNCCACQKPKPTLVCGSCESKVCKNCAQFLDEGQFSFLTKIPAALSHSTYCPACFDQHVASELDSYNRAVEVAKNILVYEKKQSKETRLLSRKEKPVRVESCQDSGETILRLAFLAAQAGFNAIIDVQLSSTKTRNGSYQTTTWSGTGIPSNVAANKIAKDRSLWQNPN